MTIKSILPPASTALERAIDGATAARLAAIDAPIDTIWNAATIAAPLLPWLGWGLSIDRWNVDWTEAQKRTAIADAIEDQRRKGTPARLRDILASYEPLLSLVEWFDMMPVGVPHTFEVRLERGDPRTPAQRTQLVLDVLRDIAMVKPVRSHFRFVQLLAATLTVGLVGVLAVGSFVRLDAPLVNALPLPWASYLQTEAGEPIEIEASSEELREFVVP